MIMKVTVCFGSTRVVVPCGQGDFQVRDLISKAIPRYRKATGKPSDSWVTVHNLRQLDGGILDPDDRLQDVADDREQIIAIYDEETEPQQGDGTSASDESENPSPDIFKNSDHRFEPFSRNGIDITDDELNGTPSPLHVRRGSEPALNRLSPIPPYTAIPPDPSKRWSAAPVIEDQCPPSSTPRKEQQNHFDGPPGERGEGSGEEKLPSSSSASSSASSHHSATTTTLARFSRDGNRCSVQILSDNPNMARWAEAADRVIEASGMYGRSEGTRKEPLGGAASTPPHSRDPSFENQSSTSSRADSNVLIILCNDGSPLGIHVIPSTDRNGHDEGLLVEGIEPDGRVARDGRIQVHDVIIEINNQSLCNVSFLKAQEIFKDAMRDLELCLLVKKKETQLTSVNSTHERLTGTSLAVSARKTPSITLSSRTQAVIMHSNTRRMGKILNVSLLKGTYGLGFSITTRDNPAGGEAPIYIKNILPKGAAIEDGTLRIGDRLLAVNGTRVTGYSQSEVASLLRQIPVGGISTLLVSRQEKVADIGRDNAEDTALSEDCPSPKLPRQLVSERMPEDSLLFPWKQREILTFEIPIHDSERAGLGVSVKGKTTSSGLGGSVDLGIFVKNVIHGGAASRDGRLKQNDHLLNINGLSLLGKSNGEAMKALRTAMHQEGPTPGMITLSVARRVDLSKSGKYISSGKLFVLKTPTPDHSGTSENSDSTVICNLLRDPELERSIEGSSDLGISDSFPRNNPVIQRITGINAALRNESYYKATHDTWSNSQLQPVMGTDERETLTRDFSAETNQFGSPTVNLPSRDTVLIHEEYNATDVLSRRMSSEDLDPVSSSVAALGDERSQSSDAYISQSSLEEAGPGFSRDQVGRQSMSEKRHATLDAKNTDTYQRNKKAREEREKYRQQMYAEMGLEGITRGGKSASKDVGPGLGMRKSSSLESLQTMVQELAMEEECQRSGSGRVPRGRGCNESFRAAVDRSYDAPLSSTGNQMETLAEEESESLGSGFGQGNSRQSSLSSSTDYKNRKGYRKKPGLFKGLGSMFRFGKNRKGQDHSPHMVEEHLEASSLKGQRTLQAIDNDSSQELSRNLEMNLHSSVNKGEVSGETQLIGKEVIAVDDDSAPSRSERMHQLRAEHQRRHAQRNGTYPTDDSEEKYEHVIKQVLSDDVQADRVNNNMAICYSDSHDSSQLTHPEDAVTHHTQSNTFLSPSSSTTLQTVHATPNIISPSGTNASLRYSDTSVNKTRSRGNRSSLYGSCFQPQRHSPSPPDSPAEICHYQNEADAVNNTSRFPGMRRHSLHIDVNLSNSTSSDLVCHQLANDNIRELIHKNVCHKPPLPPRNRLVNNNYRAPVPPSTSKPVYLMPLPQSKVCPIPQNSCSLDNIIGPDFTFTFSKPIPHDCIQTKSLVDQNLILENWKLDEVAQNIVNHTQSDLDASYQTPVSSNQAIPEFNANHGLQINGEGSSTTAEENGDLLNPRKSSLQSFNVDSNHNTDINLVHSSTDAFTSQPLGSSSSSSSSTQSVGSVRTNSLPRMGLMVKTVSKWWRSSPCPPPPPPPKGLPNPLAPLRSTEVLDESRLWRMDPVPPEPKAEIQHIRSRSYDFYGDGRPGSRGNFVDPNKFSHYVNYEQIQLHLRKNREQERLAKLASQQFQDFRDKQTSREQREYQSQRCARELSPQQRPVSNYFEYESVQAMITHAKHNHSQPATASLPRRHQQPSPQHPNSSLASHSGYHHNQGSIGVSASQGSKNSSSLGTSSKGHSKSQNQSGMMHLPIFSRGQHPPPPPVGGREGHYAASGYRPASQYSSAHRHTLSHNVNTSLTVSGSKV